MPPRLGINWEITKKCNLRCVYCRVNAGEEMKGELSFSQAKKVVDKLFAAGYSHLKFTGGEPLIKDYFWDLVKYAHKKKMLVSMFTNTLLITKETLPLFKKYVSMVAVSLDSLYDEHNHLLRRPNADVVINHIKELKKIGLPVAISATVTKINLHDLPELISLAKEIGADELKINDFVANGRACNNINLLKFERPFLDYLPEIVRTVKDTFNNEDVEFSKFFKCECDNSNLFINYKGDLYPCVELSYVSEYFKLGNLVLDLSNKLFSLNDNFYKQITKKDICAYSYFHSSHFSACINRDKCPLRLAQYMRKAKDEVA